MTLLDTNAGSAQSDLSRVLKLFPKRPQGSSQVQREVSPDRRCARAMQDWNSSTWVSVDEPKDSEAAGAVVLIVGAGAFASTPDLEPPLFVADGRGRERRW